MTGTVFENGETPYGKLYKPQGGIVQFVTLCAAFFGGPAFGLAVGAMLGGVSDSAQVALYLPFVAIFFMGYGLWVARLNMLAFNLAGWGLLKTFFTLLILRRTPSSVEDVLPSAEKLAEAAVKAQKAGWSFFTAAVPVAAIAALGAAIMDADLTTVGRVTAVSGACLLWGCALGWLARHAYLPIMDEE